jgi:PEP-CTERM motif
MISKPAKLFTVLLLAFPMTVWAHNVGFQSSGGQITSNGSTLNVSSSTLTSLIGMTDTGSVSGNLGIVSFSTGALMSGTLAAGGQFAGGGSFSMMGNGSNGLPHGVIFHGQFSGPVTWTANFVPTGNAGMGAWFYTLSGSVAGTLSNGQSFSANVKFSTRDVAQGQQYSSVANLNNGAGAVTVPEPGTLGLLASGLFGLAVVVRRRLAK